MGTNSPIRSGAGGWIIDALTSAGSRSSCFARAIEAEKTRIPTVIKWWKFRQSNTDRWSAYNWLDNRYRQLCWAHLKRDFQALVERGGDSQTLGEALLICYQQIFAGWHLLQKGALSRSQFQDQMRPIRTQVGELLRQGLNSSHSATAGTCRDILKREAALWTFIDTSGVEPTNNFAEQKIRPGVLWRNTSFGTQSDAGSRFVERIMTVVSTLKQQKRNLLDFLTEASEATYNRRSAPSLLPAP